MVELTQQEAIARLRAEVIATLKQREKALQATFTQLQETGNKLGSDMLDLRQKLAARGKQPDVPVISG
jgi:prefoldin subunit 5